MKEFSFVVFASRQSALLKGGENLMHAVYDVFTGFLGSPCLKGKETHKTLYIK